MDTTQELYTDPEVIYRNYTSNVQHHNITGIAIDGVKNNIAKYYEHVLNINPDFNIKGEPLNKIGSTLSNYILDSRYVYTYRHALNENYEYCNYIVILENMNEPIRYSIKSKNHMTALYHGSNFKIVHIFNQFNLDDQIKHILVEDTQCKYYKCYRVGEIVNDIDYYRSIYVPFFKGFTSNNNYLNYTGIYFDFATDGTLTTIGYLKNGLKNDLWKIYKNHILIVEGRFEDNIKSGLWICYYDDFDNRIGLIGSYINNKKQGKWIVYSNVEYDITSLGFYEQDKKMGMWYEKNNNCVECGKYHEDIRIGEWLRYNTNNINDVHTLNCNITPSHTLFYMNGEIISEEVYKVKRLSRHLSEKLSGRFSGKLNGVKLSEKITNRLSRGMSLQSLFSTTDTEITEFTETNESQPLRHERVHRRTRSIFNLF